MTDTKTDNVRTVGDLFSNYQQEAFRLEMLAEYRVPDEWQDFEQYQETGIAKQNQDLIDYIAEAKGKISSGKRHIRARVIPNPITQYFIFETLIGYIPQSLVGFELNFLEATEYNSLLISIFGKTFFISDFWLFDKKDLAIMNYDERGQFVSIKIVEDVELIEKCVTLRNSFISKSHSLSYLIDKYKISLPKESIPSNF